MLTKEDRQKISEYLSGQKKIDVAYLFGSQSTGKAGILSDIDIAVLFDKKISKEDRFNEKLTIAGELGSLLKSNKVEVVDLNSAPPALRFSAIEKRDILFVRSDSERSTFEADTMSKYQDYRYFLQSNTTNSLGSISNMPL